MRTSTFSLLLPIFKQRFCRLVTPGRFVLLASSRIDALPVNQVVLLSFDDLLFKDSSCLPHLAFTGMIGMMSFEVFDRLLSFAQTCWLGSVRFMLPLLTCAGHHVRVRRTELRDKAKKLREQAMVSGTFIEGTKNKGPPKKRIEDDREMAAGA